MSRIRLLILSLIFALGLTSPALAANEWIDYSPASFGMAQATGKKIVVHVTADWCSTCQAQHPILDALLDDSRTENTLFVRVDYDTDREFLRKYRVATQSTVMVFRGADEIDRSVADTNRERLQQFVLNTARSE